MDVNFKEPEKLDNFWLQIDELCESAGEFSPLKQFSLTHFF